MSDDFLRAAKLVVEGCDPDCSCQSVHIVFEDADGDGFATASFSPDVARRVAADLLNLADMAEARRAGNEGRLQ